MPSLNALEHRHTRPWETVAEVVWKRYPAAVRFQERKELTMIEKVGVQLSLSSRLPFGR